MDLKEVNFREALKILINDGVVMVRNPEMQDGDLYLKMTGEDGALSSSDGCYYNINDFGNKDDHYYDVGNKYLNITIKSGECIKRYIVAQDSGKITIDLRDFINK